jgi:ankyrin repeat protein
VEGDGAQRVHLDGVRSTAPLSSRIHLLTRRLASLAHSYISVPQIGSYLDGEANDLMEAVASIPAYVERSSHFFAVVPTVKHADLKGVECGLGSWLDRGWVSASTERTICHFTPPCGQCSLTSTYCSQCRVEMYALFLSRSEHLPVIVVKGGEAPPYMMACQACASRPPGCGTFTCCARNHRMPNPDGTWRSIPCDKEVLGPVMWRMLSSLIKFRLGDERLYDYRLWSALVPHVMQDLPVPDESALYSPASVPDFLRIFRFKTPNEEGNKRGSGFSPLFVAVVSGNVPVARALIDTHGANIHITTHQFDTMLGFDKGSTPLHAALAVCPPQHVDEMIKLLLDAGLDPNRGTKAGVAPLHAGVWYHNLAAVKALLKHAEGKLRLDAVTKLNNDTGLGLAVFASTTEMVATLIEAGADVTQTTYGGGTKLISAVQNPAATPEMLELLCASNKINVNQRYKPLTRKWYLIERFFECLYKSRFVSNTDFITSMAHSRGATALHFAATQGHIHLIEWLLQHGAHHSLHLRNKLGCTPIDLAHIFGPFPEAEAQMGAAIMDNSFHTRYVLRRGSHQSRQDSVVRQDAHAPATEGAAGAIEHEVELAPDAEITQAAAHHVAPAVGKGEGGSTGDSSGGGGGGNRGDHGGGVWDSVTSAISSSLARRHTSDALVAELVEGAPHTADSARLRAMLESIVEAQTRTLRADNAAMRAEITAQVTAQIASLRADLNLSV